MKIKKLQIKKKEKQEFDAHTQMFVRRSKNISIRNHTTYMIVCLSIWFHLCLKKCLKNNEIKLKIYKRIMEEKIKNKFNVC